MPLQFALACVKLFSSIFISDDNSAEEDKLKKSGKLDIHELDRFRSTKSGSENQERSQKAKGDLKIIQFLELKFPFH